MKTIKVNFQPVRVWGPDEAPPNDVPVSTIHIGERTGPVACYVEQVPDPFGNTFDARRVATAAERFTKRKWRAWSHWDGAGIGITVGLLKGDAA